MKRWSLLLVLIPLCSMLTAQVRQNVSALQTTFEAGPASSSYGYIKAPKISEKGLYIENSQGRLIRVFTSIDRGLMLGDFFSKLEQRFGAESK